MIALVTGGSGSGKSVWAENLALRLTPGEKIYIATMRPFGEEAQTRIARHRTMRAEKGFKTLECQEHLTALPKGSTALLECMSNLTANVMFAKAPPVDCVSSIWAELEGIMDTCAHLVIVSNEIFSDGVLYDQETLAYIACLGRLNCQIVARADLAVEVVCGLPLLLKGALPC